ncbi:hypothetical protein NKJ70_19670 [Mesorhizobium sp. M0092]|uniref:hypothetical protein n=1 Tax=Mesorhizobium sp. M0092 TaxID=2956876 RepID=UPI003339F3E5
MHIGNFGQTPAKDLTAWAGMQVCKIPPEPSIFAKRTDLFLAKSYLAPGAKLVHTIQYGAALTEEWVVLLLRGEAAIYVYGEIRYLDIFGKPCWANFRYGRGGPHGHPSNGEMPATEYGNETH